MNKNSRRVNSKGKFVVPTKEEIKRDREHYMTQRLAEIVQDGDKLIQMMLNLNYKEEVIKFREHQLGIDRKTMLQTNLKNIKEQFNGTTKPEPMLIAEYHADIFTYKVQIREFERLKEKFVKEYQFTDDMVKNVLQGQFDWFEYSRLKKEEMTDGIDKKDNN